MEIVKNIYDIIYVLNKSYGANRQIESDLGGYVVIAENIVDI